MFLRKKTPHVLSFFGISNAVFPVLHTILAYNIYGVKGQWSNWSPHARTAVHAAPRPLRLVWNCTAD